jgi:hypothetical protein
MVAAGSSSRSFNSYSSRSIASLAPETPGYHYEFERLQLEYRRSQENLKIEQEFVEAQKRLHERDIAEREARHQEELEELRRELALGSGKSKRKF